MRLSQQEFYAKGKRGITYTALLDSRKVLVKIHNPDAVVDTIKHEAAIMQRLNPQGIGPRFIAYDQKRRALIREFIEGEEFADYLEKASKKEIVRVLTEIFYQCRKLDLLGINKLELTRPYKHILVTTVRTRWRPKGSVVQIDFERCRESEKPKNVTQFAQCVARGRLQEIFRSKGMRIDGDKLLELTKKYKKCFEKKYFDDIIRAVGGLPRKPESFAERVYERCAAVPKGKVTTYGAIARQLKGSAQAVGQALKHNPYAPRIPCHRVVAADGKLGGFAGAQEGTAIARKKKLLEQEGVRIIDSRIADFRRRCV